MNHLIRAVLQRSVGGYKTLFVGRIPRPSLEAFGHVRLKVKAAGVNRLDILQREGHYPPPLNTSDILGVEVSGIVSESLSSLYNVGDEVMALVQGGGYSEEVVVADDLCMLKPENLSFVEAAAIPESWLTAYQLLYKIANIGSDREISVAIHAAASGVGTAALQLCRLAGVKNIIALSRHINKLDNYAQYGATRCTSTADRQAYVTDIMNHTHGSGVDVLLDCVGASLFDENLKICNQDARWILFGLLGGGMVHNFHISKLLQKRISFISTTLRSRPHEYRASLIHDFRNSIIPLIEKGDLRCVIYDTFPLSRVHAAHMVLENNENRGKVILKVDDD